MIKSTTFFILAIVITTCAADGLYASHVSSDQDALLENIINLMHHQGGDKIIEPAEVSHVMTRRQAANPVTVWVEGYVNHCVQPSSTIRLFCQINYVVPSVIVKRVSKTLQFIITNYALLQNQLSIACRNSLKEVLCKGTLPKCSSDQKSATYLSYGSACAQLGSCGSNVVNLNGLNTQSLCQATGQQFTISACVKSSLTSINSQYCGPLPSNIAFPAWVEAGLYRRSSIISSLRSTFDHNGISAACTDQWIKMSCTNSPFCSSDRTKIVSGVTRQHCQSALSCLPAASQNIIAMAWDCNAYPDENGEKMIMPSTMAYSNRAVSMAISPFLLIIASLLSLMLF